MPGIKLFCRLVGLAGCLQGESSLYIYVAIIFFLFQLITVFPLFQIH